MVVSAVSRDPRLFSNLRHHCAVSLVSFTLCILHSISSSILAFLGLGILVLGFWTTASYKPSRSPRYIQPHDCLQKLVRRREIPGTKNVIGWLRFGIEVPNVHASLYFKINGKPVRVAWTERSRETPQDCKAVLLVPPGNKMETLTCEGPFITPMTPYAYGPDQLDIVVTDSGIIEGYSCLRWRCRILNPLRSSTNLTWFCKDLEFLVLFLEHLETGTTSGTIRIIFYIDPMSDGEIHPKEIIEEALEEAGDILRRLPCTQPTLHTEYGSLRAVLRRYMFYSEHQYSTCLLLSAGCML